MTNTYAQQISEAVREAAARLIESKENGIWANTCGPSIRALGLDAIIASVPVQDKEGAKDD